MSGSRAEGGAGDAEQGSGCRTGWMVAQVTEVGSLEEEQGWGAASRTFASFELAEMGIHELSLRGYRRQAE